MSHKFVVFLLVAGVLVSLAMGNRVFPTTKKKDDHSEPSSNPISPSPLINDQNTYKSQAPTSRKPGKHHHHQYRHNPEVSSPSEGPSQAQSIPPVGQPASSSENISLQEEIGHEVDLKRHGHSVDKSVAGGGVILGGLATTFLVAVFCYIRATGRHKTEANV